MEYINRESLYHLFLEIEKLHYNRSHLLLDEIGIYHGQPHLLFALSETDGLSQTELARKLNVKASTITVMLSRMEKANLVKRKQDNEDKRITRVFITEDGRELCQKSIVTMKKIGSDCFGSFTDEEKNAMKLLLMKMKANLIAAGENTDNSK